MKLPVQNNVRAKTIARLSLTFAFALCLVPCSLKAQARVPEEILQKLDSLFPANDHVAWSKKRSTYTADFIYQDLNVSMTFERNGKITRSIQEIEQKNLPEHIALKVEKIYAHCKILYVIIRRRGAKMEYEIELMKGSNLYIVNFDKKGRLVDVSELYKNSIFFPIVN